MTRKRKFLIIAMLCVVIILSGIFAGVLYFTKDRTFCGFIVDGIDLSGMPVALAADKLEEERGSNLPKYIRMTAGEKEYNISLESIEGFPDFLGAVERGMEHYHKKGLWCRVINQFRPSPEPVEFNIPFKCNEELLSGKIKAIAGDLNREPRDALIVIKKGIPVMEKEQAGLKLEVEKSLESCTKFFSMGMWEEIPLVVFEEDPEIKVSDLPAVDNLLASYNTEFSTRDSNRAHNIIKSAEKINGTILAPGDIFSFFRVVGPVTRDAGFQNAPVIMDGEFIPGIGGGVCQVSSTLYQAALRSGLEIIERHNHSRPVHYMSMGLDAAVAEGILNLRFKNNKDEPVMITTYVRPVRNGVSALKVSIYGGNPAVDGNKKIEVESQIIEVLKPAVIQRGTSDLYTGEQRIIREGKNGYRVAVYLVITEKGEIQRKRLDEDTYRPLSEIVEVGTAVKKEETENKEIEDKEAAEKKAEDKKKEEGEGEEKKEREEAAEEKEGASSSAA